MNLETLKKIVGVREFPKKKVCHFRLENCIRKFIFGPKFKITYLNFHLLTVFEISHIHTFYTDKVITFLFIRPQNKYCQRKVKIKSLQYLNYSLLLTQLTSSKLTKECGRSMKDYKKTLG